MICHQLSDGPFSAQRVEKNKKIIKFTKKTKNVRMINDTIFSMFLGSRNHVEWLFLGSEVNFDLQGHLKVIWRSFRAYFRFNAPFWYFLKIKIQFWQNIWKIQEISFLKMVKFLKFWHLVHDLWFFKVYTLQSLRSLTCRDLI